jgi:O-methyltransferase involved in polyketide biosynthesis
LLPYLPGQAQDKLFEQLHEMSAAGSRAAVELGPDPGDIQKFADALPFVDDSGQPRVGDLWYDDPRRDTKDWLTERDWTVSVVDILGKAAAEYGRPIRGLPGVFEEFLRTKFFTALRR